MKANFLVKAVSPFLLAAAMPMASMSASAASPDWPVRPIQIIVPFSAGAATDLISRRLGQEIAAELGQPVVVENRPGAAASIGSALVARAAPDGYTLLMSGPASMVTNRFTIPNLSYDPSKFRKIAVLAYTPNLLLANPSLPFKTLPEMVAYAKAHPGELTYASFGAGTTSHLAGEMLKKMAGIDLLHVPYKGASDAIPALLSGQVSMYFDTIMTGLPHVKTGKLNALAISTARRSDMAPDVPTVAEQGYQGYDIAPWYGLVAPEGTPDHVIERLSTAIDRIVRKDSFRDALRQTGAEPMIAGPEDFTRMVDAELPRTRELIEQSGMQLQ